ARRRHEEVWRGRAQDEERLVELRALAEAGDGLTGGLEGEVRADRESLRHGTELAAAADAAAQAPVPDDGPRAAWLVAGAGRALETVAGIAPELRAASSELADIEIRLREAGSELRAFAASLEAEPDRLEQVEAELARIAAAKRRFGHASYDELL